MTATETATDLFLGDGHDEVARGVIAAVRECRAYTIRVSRHEPHRWVFSWQPVPVDIDTDPYSANPSEHRLGPICQGMDDAARLAQPGEWAMDLDGDQAHARPYRSGYVTVLGML